MEGFFFSVHKQRHPEKQNKKRLTEDQVAILEKSFACNKKLEVEQKLELSNQLGVPARQTAVWYQNKRARWKTQSLEVDYGALQRVMAEKKQLERDVERLKVELKEAMEMLLF